MFTMPIHSFQTIALICVIIATILLILWCIIRVKYISSLSYDYEHQGTISIDKVDRKGNKKTVNLTRLSRKSNSLRWVLILMRATMIISYILAFASIITFVCFRSKALKYGAYDDFEYVESIDSINELPSKSFIDQSNDLPSDLTNCTILYFRYNCKDCWDTHDEIIAELEKYKDYNVYTVSSRSEKGKELLNDYPVDGVPSAVYISNASTKEHQSYLLYEKPTGTEKALFVPNNLAKAVLAQKG